VAFLETSVTLVEVGVGFELAGFGRSFRDLDDLNR